MSTATPTDGIVLTPAQASALLGEYMCFEYSPAAEDLYTAADGGIVRNVFEARVGLDNREAVVRTLHHIAEGEQAEPFALEGMRDRMRELVLLGVDSIGDNLCGLAKRGSATTGIDVRRTLALGAELLGILEQLDA